MIYEQETIRWMLELSNQEYSGDIILLFANIKHLGEIE